MRVAVQKWGNSLAVRIPRALAQAVHLERGGHVDLGVEDGRLVAVPVRRRYSLEELLASVEDEQLHGEVDWGAPVGKEAW